MDLTHSYFVYFLVHILVHVRMAEPEIIQRVKQILKMDKIPIWSLILDIMYIYFPYFSFQRQTYIFILFSILVLFTHDIIFWALELYFVWIQIWLLFILWPNFLISLTLGFIISFPYFLTFFLLVLPT